MITALRRGELGTAPAGAGNTDVFRRDGRKYRLPVTWPLIVLFVAFPLWWVLGLSALIWSVLAAPMLIGLIWQRRTTAPAVIILWLVFTLWVLMCGLQLHSGTKIVTFTYRLTLYACAGILFLYVYNLPRSRRVDAKVLRIMTIFWMIVVLGGYLGVLVGSHTFTPALDYVLPHSLRSQPFVQELVQPVFANVVKFLGYPVPRPAAPFPYTNNWGGNIAVLTPVAFAAIANAKAGGRRKVLILFLVASLVPMVVSLNRGMFLSLGIGLAYVAIRLAMRGRVSALVALMGLVAVSALLIALTPLNHLVLNNLSSAHGNSNTTRLSVAQQSVQGANQSPLFGYGEPQAVTGQGGTPPIGSQGQLWMLLYSDGYLATALFIGFFLVALWQTRRARGTVGLWLHAVPLIALAQISFYGWLPVELQVVMVIAALAYRRCWASPTLSHASNAHVPAPRVAVGSRGASRTAMFGRTRRSTVWRPADRVSISTGHVSTALSDSAVSRQAADPTNGLSAASKVVVRGSLINLVAMVAGALMSFGLVILVSRWLQPRGAGVFFELIALFTILSNTFELGADTGLTRWISRARVVGGLNDVHRIVLAALIPVALVGTGAAVALWLEAPEVAHLFVRGIPASAGAMDIRYMAPLIPLSALSACIVDGVRGFGRMWPYLVIEGIGKPAVRIAAVATVLILGLGLRVAIIVWGLPIIAGLILGCIIFVRVLRQESPAGARRRAEPASAAKPVAAEPMASLQAAGERLAGPAPAGDGLAGPATAGEALLRERPEYPSIPELDATVELPVVFDPVPPDRSDDDPANARPDGGRHRAAGYVNPRRGRELAAEFWGFTGPRAFQATFQIAVLWLDILIVGALTSSYQAGIYTAVSKLAIIGTFPLEGNRLAIGPQLSAALARREHGRAAELYQTATRSLILATWPFYIVLATFPVVILGIFGPKYSTGGTALTVLALAMLFNLGTGNVTVVLLMGGKSSWSALNAGAALIANVVLNVVLDPRLGILGAAIAWAASIIIDNVTAVVEVWRLMGLDPFGPGYWVAAGVTATCFGGTAMAARLMLGDTKVALLAAVVAGVAGYAVALYVGRGRLQLAGLLAALRPGRPATAVGPAQLAPQPHS